MTEEFYILDPEHPEWFLAPRDPSRDDYRCRWYLMSCSSSLGHGWSNRYDVPSLIDDTVVTRPEMLAMIAAARARAALDVTDDA